MKHFMQKVSLFFMLVLVVALIPICGKAATIPAFRTTRTTVYENSEVGGVYSYTVSGVEKGYKVKWGITGGGKAYVKLDKKTTKVTETNQTTVSNNITINTAGNMKAGNKKFNVIAKVYDKSGKLIKTLKDKPTIKIQTENITLDTSKISNLNNISVGGSYDFNYKVVPANTTSNVYWSVTSTEGVDYSSEITTEGVWTPKAMGEYIITATAKNLDNGQVLASDRITITVGTFLKSIKQIGIYEFRLEFNQDVKGKLNKNNVLVKEKTGNGAILPKTFSYDTTGKIVTITTQHAFKNGKEYQISYGKSAISFKASAGKPVRIEILTQQVPVKTWTEIEYALYDAADVNVKDIYTGSVNIEGNVWNGYKEGNKLYMTEAGSTTTISIVYKPSDGGQGLTASKAITCVEETIAETATSTSFTITSSSATPDYNADDYEENYTVTLGEKAYVHFRALDAKGNALSYDYIYYNSSDNNTLIVDSNGALTPIKTGIVNLFVTILQGGEEFPYSYQVTINEEKQLSSIELSRQFVTMARTYQEGYQETVDITAYDQYGTKMSLSNATVTITEANKKMVFASYDAENQNLVLKDTLTAGIYDYTVKVTINGKTATSILGLEVKEVPATGAVTYKVQIDNPTIDMTINKNTTSDKTANIRLAQYRGGIFESYISFNSAVINKDGKYYSTDLTTGGTKSEVTIGGSTILPVTAMQLVQGSEAGECKKAETGTYTISLKYYDTRINANQVATATLKVTDAQKKPEAVVRDTVSLNTKTNALDLVKECIVLSSGEIYDCTAVGETKTGREIVISKGKQLHIKTISVRELIATGSETVPSVYIYHTINIGLTLTNR